MKICFVLVLFLIAAVNFTFSYPFYGNRVENPFLVKSGFEDRYSPRDYSRSSYENSYGQRRIEEPRIWNQMNLPQRQHHHHPEDQMQGYSHHNNYHFQDRDYQRDHAYGKFNPRQLNYEVPSYMNPTKNVGKMGWGEDIPTQTIYFNLFFILPEDNQMLLDDFSKENKMDRFLLPKNNLKEPFSDYETRKNDFSVVDQKENIKSSDQFIYPMNSGEKWNPFVKKSSPMPPKYSTSSEENSDDIIYIVFSNSITESDDKKNIKTDDNKPFQTNKLEPRIEADVDIKTNKPTNNLNLDYLAYDINNNNKLSTPDSSIFPRPIVKSSSEHGIPTFYSKPTSKPDNFLDIKTNLLNDKSIKTPKDQWQFNSGELVQPEFVKQ